jgi:hypothetical protein
MLGNMLAVPSLVYVVVYWACLIGGVFAFIDAATRRADAYVAIDRKTKRFWLIVLGLGVLAQIVFPVIGFGLRILGIAGIVAAIVYLVDVRKKIIEITRGGGSRW